MTTALIALAVMWRPSFQAAQDTQTYTDPKLGLSFAHPTTWLLESPAPVADSGKRSHKKKKGASTDSVHFKVPLTGAAEDGDLLIMRASFSGSKEVWQQVQVDANKSLKRTVDRQWNQEILGVPLLLTRISYSDNGADKTTLTGLLYTDTNDKLLFRLTGPTSDFDKAQYEFTEAMQTLRTTNNELPKEQDPDHPSQPVTTVNDRGLKHPLYLPPGQQRAIISPIAVPMVVSTKNVELRIPRGWTAEHVEGNTLQLTNPKLSYPVKIHLATTLDSDPVSTALGKQCADSLTEFDKVEHRYDSPIEPNQADCVLATVWREGRGSKGPLITLDAAGKSGDFYFIASCRPIAGETAAVQKKILFDLLDQISIELIQ